VRLDEATGSKIVPKIADVRHYGAVQAAFDGGIAQLGGRVDTVIANAGVVRFREDHDFLGAWNDIIGINLTGVFHTVRAAIPTMIAGERGGSIVIMSSSAGIRGTGTDKAGRQAYAASKRGVVGLMQVLANERNWA
jgi:NAD(P)-dependent dehydrogenase (short-subunit alcohol dehydrogenase family)